MELIKSLAKNICVKVGFSPHKIWDQFLSENLSKGFLFYVPLFKMDIKSFRKEYK